jgi:hypothetical protein
VILLVTEQQNLKPVLKPFKGRAWFLLLYLLPEKKNLISFAGKDIYIYGL